MTTTSDRESQLSSEEASGLATAQLLQQGAPSQPAGIADETSGEHQEQDAIAAYMAELLQRHNPAAAPPPEPTPESTQAEVPVDEVISAEPTDEASQQRVPVAPPERRGDLAVMRQLANSTARNALDAYSSTRVLQTLSRRFWLAVTAMLISTVMAYQSSGVMTLTFLGSVIALGVASLAAARFLLLVRHVQVSAFVEPASGVPALSGPPPSGDVLAGHDD